jgi:propionate CoA-transferase
MGGLAAEEGVGEMVTLTTEPGAVGGEPGADLFFGTSRNAEALIEQAAMFDWYDGGGLDMAFLGLAQTDQHGNVNVSRFSGHDVGPGGFINITQATKTIVYCGSFTAGGLEVATGSESPRRANSRSSSRRWSRSPSAAPRRPGEASGSFT